MKVDQEAAFLKELGVSGNLAFALAAAGVTREEALAHRDARPVFERLWRRMVGQAADAAANRT